MTQQTLAGFEKYGKTTRRAQFLAEMEQVVPWSQLCALIEPVYPKGRQRGRWPAAGAVGTDVADLPAAAVVQPVGSGC